MFFYLIFMSFFFPFYNVLCNDLLGTTDDSWPSDKILCIYTDANEMFISPFSDR